ncbi:MAG TPA: lysozyme inhibitor LprI family protein [Terracidiphilus sp.]|jgi:uncharacterized protein YecT (DUF1311 family)
MASVQASSRRCVFFPMLVLSAMLLPAQTPQVPPAAPQYVQFQNPIPSGQLAFLTGYAGRTTRELMKDKQFKALLKLTIPRTEYHYGRDMSLSDALDVVLSGSPLAVNIRDGRFVIVTGKQGPYLHGRGFLWFDLQEGVALGGFYFSPTNGEPSPTFTIFSRQLTQTSLALGQFPQPFVDDVSQWSMVSSVPEISPRYFIPENGKKYVLEHDEDYCWHPEGTPAPAQDQCLQANLAAANADVDAGYFMQQTRHAANATAWMLDPQQSAWLTMRESTCLGPGALGCRLRVTRQRVRVILGPAPPPRPRPMQASR